MTRRYLLVERDRMRIFRAKEPAAPGLARLLAAMLGSTALVFLALMAWAWLSTPGVWE